ncbi:MAG TPA: hypothetical protein VKP65_25165 [Rhodothermales bacterium]|nr:hypothetical protein [Rhodothermales bacterium]
MSFRSLLSSLCVLSLLLVLGACASTSDPSPVIETAGPTATIANVAAFLSDVMTQDPSFNRDDLVARLGEPVRAETEPANSAGAATTAVYYGLEVGLQEEGNQSSVSWIALTDARHTSPDGLRVGLAQNHILETLGRPTRQTSTRFFYEKTEPRPMTLVITLEQKAASRLEWQFK